jgi:RND family efflux transporter MFP subunit
MKTWMKALLALLAVSLVASAGYLGYRSSRAEEEPAATAPPTVTVARCDVEQTVTAPGKLVSTHQATVQMPANGSLAELLVRPGDSVTAGQVIARLGEKEQFEAAVAAAQLNLVTAQQELAGLYESAGLEAARLLKAVAEAEKELYAAERTYNALVSSATEEEVLAAKTALDLAKKRLDAAQKGEKGAAPKAGEEVVSMRLHKRVQEAQQRYDELLKRYGSTVTPAEQLELDLAEAALEVAQAQLEEAKRSYEQIKDGPASLDVQVAEAKVADAEAKLATARTDLEDVEIRAPFAGVVLEVKADPGEVLAEGTPLVVLTDPQALEIEATVIEEDLPYVGTGQDAVLFFDALPELAASGKVTRLVPQRLPGDRPLYSLFISLAEIPAELVAGMTADASITIAAARDVLCLPRSILRASAGETTMVTVWTGDREEKREVEIGLRGDVNVEIRSGLQEGEEVVR